MSGLYTVLGISMVVVAVMMTFMFVSFWRLFAPTHHYTVVRYGAIIGILEIFAVTNQRIKYS